MKTILLLGCLLTSAAQAQNLSTAQLTHSLNGGTNPQQTAVYSSQPVAAVVKPGATQTSAAGLQATKQYNGNLTVSYSTFYQWGLFGAGDFYKIQTTSRDLAEQWPTLIDDAVREGLKELARKAGYKNENLFLTTDNINSNIARVKAQPIWQDLFNTANSLRDVYDKTPTFKEAGGFSTGLQISASSPLINPNGQPNYSRVITSFPFTVR